MLTVEKNYEQLAGKTEATDFEGKIYSKKLQQQSLDFAIKSAQFLDIIKKHFFYNRNYSQQTYLEKIHELEQILSELKKHNIEDVLQHTNQDNYTYSSEDIEDLRLYHAILGIITEGGELGEALQKHLETNDTLDWVNLAEENGDIDWYQAIIYNIAEETGINELTVRTKNINKLAKRYGEKFSDYQANHRDLESERKILEQ